ncbi:hypothetical protein [Moorena producens]|uniref:hypothetical protein n=1 Tax=Moorena producens TaxID=1155739 RepID=UPI0011EA6DDB|nr:hypothetical protein [Moorena producens]
MSKVNMGKVSTAHPTSLPTLHLLHLYLGWWAVLNNNVKGEYGEGKHCPPYISAHPTSTTSISGLVGSAK